MLDIAFKDPIANYAQGYCKIHIHIFLPYGPIGLKTFFVVNAFHKNIFLALIELQFVIKKKIFMPKSMLLRYNYLLLIDKQKGAFGS